MAERSRIDEALDVRPEQNRREEGEVPGAEVIEMIHLEWRLDPTSAHRIPGAIAGRKVILVCNEGYSSSLAAARLQELGVDGATDLTGGAGRGSPGVTSADAHPRARRTGRPLPTGRPPCGPLRRWLSPGPRGGPART